MGNETTKTDLHVVMLAASARDRSFTVFTKPVMATRDLVTAKRIADAERSLGQAVIVEGRECGVVCIVFHACGIVMPALVKEAWVVWSSASSRDGTHKVLAKIDGVYGKEERAKEVLSSIQEGMVLIGGFPYEVRKNMAKVGIE
jgi:hypothetical protein